MEPLTLTLLGYPISILASFTYDQLKKISQKIDVNPLKGLFLKAFFTSLEYHDKYYDDYSRKVVGKLRKAVKKDESKLLIIFSKHSDNYDKFLSLVKGKEFQQIVAEEIISEYSLDLANYPKLMNSIITDCLSYYLYAFFNQMNEKEGIQAILIECLKLDTVLDILKKIDSQVVTKSDFDELRRIVLLNYFNENKNERKKFEDYNKYLRNKYKYLELRGFSPKVSGKEIQMELLDIFVPLELDIFVPLEIDNYKSTVSHILEEKVTLLQRSLKNESPNDEENKKKDPLTSILEHRNLVILGDPGSGKSTLLKYLIVKATHLRNREDLFANIIPIFIRISDYADYFKKTKISLYEFITEHYDKQYQHIFKEGFEWSKLLLLMDGLDEITDTPLRIRITERVMDLIARYPYNRYLVTSRVVGYQESKLGGEFRHFKLMPFGLDEIKLFSIQWYKSIARHTNKDYTRAEEQANSLFSSIARSPSVIRLATNPLLMTIIAMIHYKGKKLPNKRVELYDASTETFLEYWVQLRMEDESQLKDKNEIIEILAPIAFEIHQNKSNALIEEKEFIEFFLCNLKNIHTNMSDKEAKKECKQFITFLRQQTGFFYEKGVDDEGNRLYGFIHLTFEEYLSAIELISKWSEKKLDLEEYVFNPRWIEIIRLASALIRLSNKGIAGRKKSTEFVEDILSVEDRFPEAYRPLQLVCLILSDDVTLMDTFLNIILDKIIEVASKSNFNEIIESFSRLFKKVIYSDYKKAFINRFTEEVITDNSRLCRNLLYILIANSADKEIDNVLISLLKKNEEISKVIYKIEWKGFPFQKTEYYEKYFKNYLPYLKTMDEDEQRIFFNNFRRSISKERRIKSYGCETIGNLTSVIEQIHDTKIIDILLTYTSSDLFSRFLYYLHQFEDKEKLDNLLKRYPDNILVENLSKILREKKFEYVTIFGKSKKWCCIAKP